MRNRSMCKKGAFERIKKEAENEPQKLKWSILAIAEFNLQMQQNSD